MTNLPGERLAGSALNKHGSKGEYNDPAVNWIVGVVCSCIVLQTALLIVLALLIALERVNVQQTERAFQALTNGLTSLKWPLVLFGIVVVLRVPLTMVVSEIISRVFATRSEREPGAESVQWSIAGTTKELTRMISGAYDQYKSPMTEEMRDKLARFLSRAVESGETESMRDLRVLWLHKMEHHDRGEADALRRCDARVDFVYSLESATARLNDPSRRYNLVISHMGEHADAFELFSALSEEQRKRFIIYSRKAENKEFIDEADRLGVQHYTSWPWELFTIVLEVAKSLPPAARRDIPAKRSSRPEEVGQTVAPAGTSGVKVG